MIHVARVLAVALLFCTGCGAIQVRSSGRVGEPVSIDPCKLFAPQRAAIARAAGGPVVGQLEVSHEGTESTFGGCSYESTSSDAVPLSVDISGKTKSSVSNQFLLGESPKPAPGIGREALYKPYNPKAIPAQETSFALVILTERGVQLELTLRGMGATEEAQLKTATELARPAVRLIDSIFPGDDEPPREKAPVPVCSLLTESDFHELRPSAKTPPPSVELFEHELFGGNTRIGTGPRGGGWICESFIDAGYWISKEPPSQEELVGSGESVAGIGRAAVWLRTPGWWLDGVTLSILTAGGNHLEIEVGRDEGDVPLRRRIGVAMAQKALQRIP